MDIITYNKVVQAEKEINELSNNAETSLKNLITVLKGNDVIHATMIEGKFAQYITKTLATLAEANVAEFDVKTIVKFRYKYTVSNLDYRGIYFTDKNGTALSTSFQTLTTEQIIVVPTGAVKCYATVKESAEIEVIEIVGAKGDEILREQATYTDKDNSGGIKYTWSADHSTLTIKGTRTGNSFDKLAGSSSAFPTNMVAGGKYKFVINVSNPNIVLRLLFYINGSNSSNKTMNTSQIFTIPEKYTGMEVRIDVMGTNTVVDETIQCPEIYTIPDVNSFDERLTDLENAAYGNSENPLAYIRRDAGLLSVFHTVGCIGDSLSSGACAYKESGVVQYGDFKQFSWGQCLARLTGNTYYNFSQGGLSSRSWLASTHATDCFDGNHKCDAYYIGLGQNDKNNSIPVGTTADIDLEDYTQNADTYCGNMGKIIQKVQELQPKAPIFVFIDPAPPSSDQSYNDVIPDIVDLFDNVWIIDLKTYAKAMFTEGSYIIGSQYRSGHYSAVGYQEIAYVIATYTDWIIRNNLSAFKQVEFIGTSYEWTD